MNWFSKKLDYEILVPNLDKHIYQLDEDEALAYFKWFIEKIPERIMYISEVCSRELCISSEQLNFSQESLVLIWKWFRKRARIEQIVQSEEHPAKAFADISPKSGQQLTLETEYIIRDIGMYLGETFIRNNPNIHWGYYTEPRRDFFANHPLLQGFVDRSFEKPYKVCFEPIHMVGVQAAKILNKTSNVYDLVRLYDLWSQKK